MGNLTGKTLAILQARVSSTRLPGKVLLPLEGEPMLARQIERLRRAREIGRLVVATSSDPSDQPLAELCRWLAIECYRGSLDDVLDRFYRAARPHQPDYVVRLTGDCPLTDPALIDRVIAYALQGGYDYVSNCDPPTYPDGLDVEIFRFRCLEEAWREAKLPSEREHVTVFIRRQTARYKIGNVAARKDLSSLRWTVDEPEDYVLVKKIYSALYPHNAQFDTADILDYLEAHPELKTCNTQHERNEGMRKSLAMDRQVLQQNS